MVVISPSIHCVGHIGTADGSSFVRLGNTGIICGIKLEFLPALEVSEKNGNLGELNSCLLINRHKRPFDTSV